MEKPDLKKLGLDLAESTLKMAVKDVVRPYAAYYIAQSENKIDDVLLPFLDQLEGALIEVIDKIDGEKD